MKKVQKKILYSLIINFFCEKNTRKFCGFRKIFYFCKQSPLWGIYN